MREFCTMPAFIFSFVKHGALIRSSLCCDQLFCNVFAVYGFEDVYCYMTTLNSTVLYRNHGRDPQLSILLGLAFSIECWCCYFDVAYYFQEIDICEKGVEVFFTCLPQNRMHDNLYLSNLHGRCYIQLQSYLVCDEIIIIPWRSYFASVHDTFTALYIWFGAIFGIGSNIMHYFFGYNTHPMTYKSSKIA